MTEPEDDDAAFWSPDLPPQETLIDVLKSIENQLQIISLKLDTIKQEITVVGVAILFLIGVVVYFRNGHIF